MNAIETVTKIFLPQEVQHVGKELGIVPKIISGDDLKKQGFGGESVQL